MNAHRHLRPDRDGQLADRALQLAVARGLARIYADVLRDPLPPDLLRLIERLESRLASLEDDRPEAAARRGLAANVPTPQRARH